MSNLTNAQRERIASLTDADLAEMHMPGYKYRSGERSKSVSYLVFTRALVVLSWHAFTHLGRPLYRIAWMIENETRPGAQVYDDLFEHEYQRAMVDNYYLKHIKHMTRVVSRWLDADRADVPRD